jgi:hypothetical protein
LLRNLSARDECKLLGNYNRSNFSAPHAPSDRCSDEVIEKRWDAQNRDPNYLPEGSLVIISSDVVERDFVGWISCPQLTRGVEVVGLRGYKRWVLGYT